MSVRDEGTGSFHMCRPGRMQSRSHAVSGSSISNNKGFRQQQESLRPDLAPRKHLLELAPGDPGNVIAVGPFPQPAVEREIAQKTWSKPGCREPVQKYSGKMRIDREQARRGLTVDSFAYAQHFAREFVLVLLAANMLNRRVGERQIKRPVCKRQSASGALNVLKTCGLSGLFDVEDNNAIRTPNHGPHVVRSAYVQNRLTVLIVFDKVLEAAFAEIAPQGHLEFDWIHTLTSILK